jgi:hypothetical protein
MLEDKIKKLEFFFKKKINPSESPKPELIS